MGARSIHTMRELDEEIRQQRRRASDIERQLNDNLDYLHNNYRMMALRSLLDSRLVRSRVGLAGNLIIELMESEDVQRLFSRMLERLGAGLGRVFSFFKGGQKKSGATADGDEAASTS